ncbi:ZYBA0S10-01706g1_1 [Zygosaccharomyces bailii CLIB 213]|uniref:ZYBA0S10-01706g1_1 n=1 Tax=Zygosaccharomyces bailii (strain CLIB 213 / ATCC 58445 / CBS 680 / BCRC 21525 / NBRC 1098 / NCYC 1416 / NRRL Y-2227) TaxID=1333698 RepID=A0A8J2TBW5_ZYGB2|nr:ZYBA0S10-01706g1_1 [Zygosaccharomyces bailii CLIB 213]
MFKSVEYFKTSVDTPPEPDVAPKETKPKHVRLDPKSIEKDEARDRVEKLGELPKFQKRPLSDTPMTSAWNSPAGSSSVTPLTSPENSSTNLVSLNVPSLHADPGVNGIRGSTVLNHVDGTNSPSRFPHPKRRPTTIDVPGLTKSKSSPDGTISKEDPGSKLVIVMVGLPATGKSFITNKLSRYLNFSMYYCKVFNVGNTRRQYAKEHGISEQDSSFFNPDNKEFSSLRDKWAMDTLDQLLDYLLDGPGSVGIFDATNTKKKRRSEVLHRIRQRSAHLKVLFLESICSDSNVVERNIQLKLFGPDYKGKDPKSSLKDFKERLSNYLKAYEPIEDSEGIQFVKMIDVGRKVIAYEIQGFLASQTVYYLLNFNLSERQIWITRNGESEDNVKGKIGGNSHLTARGDKFARALATFIDKQRVLFNSNYVKHDHNKSIYTQCNEFFVWTSMRDRSVETSKYFNEVDYPMKEMRMLDELSAGDFEGMTYPEIAKVHPEELEERRKDKLRYRYPGIGGESYMDVTNRLRPVIAEIERIEDNVLIITHRVVARVLLGYFLNLNKDIIANVDVPLHCVYCLEMKPYGITWKLFEYHEETDDFSEVPKSALNITKVEENELVFKERRYSLVPTAPSSANHIETSSEKVEDSIARRSSSDTATRSRSTSATIHSNPDAHPACATTLAPAHGVMPLALDGGGTAVSGSRPKHITQNNNNESPLLAKQEADSSPMATVTGRATTNSHTLEIDKLNEKLSQLTANLNDNEKSND